MRPGNGCLFFLETTISVKRISDRSDEVKFDQPPIIMDGRTLIPIRAVCEKIGATAKWMG
ncbi:stalk domain-containing protein [Paenibacillus chitinolyticus]|uniref:stalk domain-containing protein n=1 Tax=Paenibacillus chitinolyticus TaxID=79263 RepID=UPI001C453975|nr:copper amine oxidase N-terminal domain-containing protein [Paenibacillus chitinolyticus]